MPPSQNRSADGTPLDSIDKDEDNRQVDIDNVWADAFEPLLAHPMEDPGKQIMNLKFLIGEYGKLLNEDRTRAINVEYKRCRRQQDKSRRDANREHRLNAIAQYNAALKTVTFDPTLPTTQQSKRGELCKQFPPDVQRDFRESGMWWSAEEQKGFRRDPEKNRSSENTGKGSRATLTQWLLLEGSSNADSPRPPLNNARPIRCQTPRRRNSARPPRCQKHRQRSRQSRHRRK